MKQELQPAEEQKVIMKWFNIFLMIVLFCAIIIPMGIYFVRDAQPHYMVGEVQYAMAEWDCSLLDVSYGEKFAVQCENVNGDVSIIQTDLFETKGGK